MTGLVEAIYVSAKKGEALRPISTAVITSTGIVGDRYERAGGTWTKDPEKRHITLIEREAIENANAELKTPFKWEETRRNIVVSGFSLNNMVKVRFWIGDVLVEGTELCTPCNHPSNLTGKEGFKSAFQNRGGLRARIIKPGMVVLGDLVRFA
jgi:MOSC domain-containing protein YiiM